MARKNEDLHGNAPDKSDVALLLIDVINDLDQMRKMLKADTRPSAELVFSARPKH